MKKTSGSLKSTVKSYTVGRRAFAKIGAVEGIHVSERVDEDFLDFERKGLSPQNRRKAISHKYAKVR